MRGGEKVLETLAEMYPQAEIFTLICDPGVLTPRLKSHRIHTSMLQRLPGSRRHFQSLLPLMPFALEHFDLSGFDLVISSESGPAKGVITHPDATHICYCHTPMRYLWDDYAFYQRQAGFLARHSMPWIVPFLRQWDVGTARRVDRFVANSHHIARRIAKYYGRTSDVIHPPVAVDDFDASHPAEDFYLCAGQLVGYKRTDLAVDAFTRMRKPLVVVGEGAELKRLKAKAGDTIRFLGRQPFPELRSLYARCRALIFPGQEDFGIVPVEAMASGKPVIAFGRGGALDTVLDGKTGLLFHEQTVESLIEAVERFERDEAAFDRAAIRAHAMRFHGDRFKEAMSHLIGEELAKAV